MNYKEEYAVDVQHNTNCWYEDNTSDGMTRNETNIYTDVAK
jgi:hypothetical protein